MADGALRLSRRGALLGSVEYAPRGRFESIDVDAFVEPMNRDAGRRAREDEQETGTSRLRALRIPPGNRLEALQGNLDGASTCRVGSARFERTAQAHRRRSPGALKGQYSTSPGQRPG